MVNKTIRSFNALISYLASTLRRAQTKIIPGVSARNATEDLPISQENTLISLLIQSEVKHMRFYESELKLLRR